MLPHRPYYDSIWFVTRTRHSRSNLLNRIFITRGRRTVYSSSAWLTKETVHPLPSHYNKNKHSFRGFLYASGAMLILYQLKRTPPAAQKLRRHRQRILSRICFLEIELLSATRVTKSYSNRVAFEGEIRNQHGLRRTRGYSILPSLCP